MGDRQAVQRAGWANGGKTGLAVAIRRAEVALARRGDCGDRVFIPGRLPRRRGGWWMGSPTRVCRGRPVAAFPYEQPVPVAGALSTPHRPGLLARVGPLQGCRLSHGAGAVRGREPPSARWTLHGSGGGKAGARPQGASGAAGRCGATCLRRDLCRLRLGLRTACGPPLADAAGRAERGIDRGAWGNAGAAEGRQANRQSLAGARGRCCAKRLWSPIARGAMHPKQLRAPRLHRATPRSTGRRARPGHWAFAGAFLRGPGPVTTAAQRARPKTG